MAERLQPLPVASKPVVARLKRKGQPDLTTLLGVAVAVAGIFGGMALEGGRMAEVVQQTGAIIVFGGTLGAVLVTTPMRVLKNAWRKVRLLFFDTGESPREAIEQIVQLAMMARHGGLIALDAAIETVGSPFLGKALMLAVDGTDIKELRAMMELELDAEERHDEEVAKVWTSAGGYAPTIGIIGAVLGLMQVMKDLTQIDKVGKGIAMAFVATIYGVASANILFLPAGAKLRARCQASRQIKELQLEGVLSIVEGMNPKLIRTKLEAFSNHWGDDGKPRAARNSAPAKRARKPAPAAAAGD